MSSVTINIDFMYVKMALVDFRAGFAGMSGDIPVKVFIRSRPFSEREKLENARECLQFFVESNQLSCNGKMFAFDGVLDPSTPQDTVYDVTASSLLEQFMKGWSGLVGSFQKALNSLSF
ncbi:unnamed protein product [Strongylus vulgaris]|uniref:Kinesin motor domain-containing protein n=1 Tax=Strongylus vulgaris TaxID=40348 RepID=A0A3P7I184_STRVU|nr:unnamed protein product [Strongylus vulgaris]